jgi:transposase
MTARIDVSSIRQRATALRLAGKSRRQIKELLDPVSNRTLDEALRGTPPPDWTRRPNAKDDLREEARDLRTQGLSYNEIAARLDVAKSSVSLWVRDLPRPERFNYVANPRRYEGLRRYMASQRQARAVQRVKETEAAAAEIGDLSDREVVIAGAIAYWCEGAKNKPNRKADRVMFINSDPGLIRFFLRFLDVAGVNRGDLILRTYIHENASVEAAERFWLEVTGVQPSQFRSPVLKHHNPKTHRTNVGENYHGCLRIDVRRSRVLYQRIEGWVSAIMGGSPLSAALDQPVSWT